MTKKKNKNEKPQKPVSPLDEANEALRADVVEQQIKAIIEKGKKKGYLTYDEMNADLPDEAVSPSRLDNLLSTLEEMGISIVDEPEVGKEEVEDFEVVSEDDESRKEQVEEDKTSRKAACRRGNLQAHRRPDSALPDANGRNSAA